MDGINRNKVDDLFELQYLVNKVTLGKDKWRKLYVNNSLADNSE